MQVQLEKSEAYKTQHIHLVIQHSVIEQMIPAIVVVETLLDDGENMVGGGGENVKRVDEGFTITVEGSHSVK